MLCVVDFYRHGLSCANMIMPSALNVLRVVQHATNKDIRDAGLSSDGKATTIEAGRAIRTQYDRVFSSPIVRCVQTAYLLFLSDQGSKPHPSVIEVEPSLCELLSSAEENTQSKSEAEWHSKLNRLGVDIVPYVRRSDDATPHGDLVRFVTHILPRRLQPSEPGTAVTQQNIAVVTHSLVMMRDLLGNVQQGVPANNAAVRLRCEYKEDAITGYRIVAVLDRDGLRREFKPEMPYIEKLLLLHRCTERLGTVAAAATTPSAMGYEAFCNDVMCGAKCRSSGTPGNLSALLSADHSLLYIALAGVIVCVSLLLAIHLYRQKE